MPSGWKKTSSSFKKVFSFLKDELVFFTRLRTEKLLAPRKGNPILLQVNPEKQASVFIKRTFISGKQTLVFRKRTFIS